MCPVDPPQRARDATPGETTPVSVRDSVTGAVVPDVGDAANQALRVNLVAGGGGGGGNVTVVNGPAGAAVNIQDGDNSITVDDGGSSLTTDTTIVNPNGTDAVNIQDGGNSITVDDGNVPLQTTVTNGGGADAVNIQDGGNSITVDDGGLSLTVDGVVSLAAFTPGTGANDLGKADGGPWTAGDTGVASLGVVDDGTVTVPSPENYTTLRLTPQTAALITGGIGAGGRLAFHVEDPGGTGWGTLMVMTDPNAGFAVNVIEVVPGTNQTDLGKLIGAAVSVGDVGVAALCKDQTTTLYVPLPAAVIGNGYSGTGVGVIPIGGVRNDLGTPFASDGQFVPLSFDQNNALRVSSSVTPSNDTHDFTAGGQVGPTIDITATAKYFSLQVVWDGAVTSWTVDLEGSLDGITWGILATHTNVDGSGAIKVPAVATPVYHMRSRCRAIVLGPGTKVTATIVGTN